MLRLLRPTLITLTVAVPTASYALGLGDIHVESALHQPLIAQIELVGAVAEDLGRLSASLASDELFQKYNLERAPFIFGTKLTVGRDAQGRPVLNMRSTEKFTEPVVTLLVDLHTPGGELVREYTLFLDPAGLVANPGAVSIPTAGSNSGAGSSAGGVSNSVAAATPALAAAPDRAAPAPDSAPASTGVPPNKLLGHTYKVARRDTLAHIATAAGARSRTEQHRLMISIYRANPAAFQNNFSRMHTGVTLTLPTPEQLAAISVEDTNREYDRQMAEWRASLHHGAASATSQANSPSIISAPPAAPAVPTSTNESQPTDHAVMTERIATLEHSLAAIQQELKRPLPTHAAAPAPASAITDEESSEDDVDDAPPVKHHGLELLAAAVGASLLFFAGAWIYLRRRNAYTYTVTPRYPVAPIVELTPAESESEIIVEETDESLEFAQPASATALSELPAATATVNMAAAAVKSAREPQSTSRPQSQTQTAQKDARNESSWFEDSFSTPIADLLNDPTVSLAVEDTAQLPVETLEPTAKLPTAAEQPSDTEVLVAPELEFAGDTVEQKFSFFNPEATTNTEHVVMDGALNATKPFAERRKNPADVLRQAIEREPERTDLRLKLLELYYTAAAENRRAFLDATRQLSRNEKLATPEDWNRIADMGRIIAPDDELFSSDIDDKRVA
jgi:pilus assembly protein FimV